MTAPDHLPHATDDCTGEWQSDDRTWRCAVCGIEHPRSRENDQAAHREYLAGAQLRSQTRQGRFPDVFKQPPPPPPAIELPDPDEEGEGWKQD